MGQGYCIRQVLGPSINGTGRLAAEVRAVDGIDSFFPSPSPLLDEISVGH